MKSRTAGWILFMVVLSTNCPAQPIGEVDTAGTTYSGSQHSGTCGRMVSEDAEGWVHVVWMNAQTSSLSVRHVSYNVWDPGVGEFTHGAGVQIDASTRAGYVTQATSQDGWCFPAFHAVAPGDAFSHACGAIDFIPYAGAFTNNFPAFLYENNEALLIDFPKIAMAADSALHMVSMELFMGDPFWGRIYYSRGRPMFFDGFGDHIEWQVVAGADQEFLMLDTSTVIAHDIACSPTGNRVAAAYIRTVSAYNDSSMLTDQDVFMRVSEDGGLTWNPAINVTQFIPPDNGCFDGGGDWACCNRDTLRPYFDLSILIDDENMIHIAFTSVFYRHWIDGEVVDEEIPSAARIWHWAESSGDFSLVAERWQPSVTRSLPNTNAMVCRPSISQNPANGFLYCSYLQFDSAQYSETDRMNADVFVSVSTNNGADWSVGVNVTNSTPETVPAGPGQSRSEMDATLPLLASDTLALFYELDYDAGAGESPTLKKMLLQRVPASAIPLTPLMPDAELHVEIVPCGESADDGTGLLPRNFVLEAYPNPFNASTTIRMELPSVMNISVKVYDLMGREVETLFAGRAMAGERNVMWTPKVSSGLYFVRIQEGAHLHTKKLLFLR